MDLSQAIKGLNAAHGSDYQCLKPKQQECIEALLNERDLMAVLPTGYGKSLIYEIIPYLRPHNTDNFAVLCFINNKWINIRRMQFTFLRN